MSWNGGFERALKRKNYPLQQTPHNMPNLPSGRFCPSRAKGLLTLEWGSEESAVARMGKQTAQRREKSQPAVQLIKKQRKSSRQSEPERYSNADRKRERVRCGRVASKKKQSPNEPE